MDIYLLTTKHTPEGEYGVIFEVHAFTDEIAAHGTRESFLDTWHRNERQGRAVKHYTEVNGMEPIDAVIKYEQDVAKIETVDVTKIHGQKLAHFSSIQ
jgi:hypothetical protein